eukprot:SAG31_NODE_585_length_13845_cov_25.623163_1_plen_65_part_00
MDYGSDGTSSYLKVRVIVELLCRSSATVKILLPVKVYSTKFSTISRTAVHGQMYCTVQLVFVDL